MKLRICDNSVRLRLLRSEVRALHETGRVSRSTTFAGREVLMYSVEASESADTRASFDHHHIRVEIPRDTVRAWACGDDVSIRATHPLDGGGALSILVEKDFECLDRDEAENADAFPNPAARDALRC